MDSIISLGQKKHPLPSDMILSGDWTSRVHTMFDKDLELVYQTKKYAELSAAEKIQADYIGKLTNISFKVVCYIHSLLESHRVSQRFMGRVVVTMQGFAVLMFSPGDDAIACLNKVMAFLTAIASLRFPSTHNQLRTSSNPRNQATIQHSKVTVQQVQGRQGQNYSGTTYKGNATSSRGNTISGQARVVKCYNCQGEGHMARQCTQLKRLRNAKWYKEKAMLAEDQEVVQILDEEQHAFLANPRIPAGQAQTIIPHNAAFQTEDLDTYDSDCDDLLTAQAVLMANISNYGSDIISEDFEQSPVMDFIDNEISSDSNIIPYS
ncbi:putative ribonuclease H-like domain-containing protein [Tanacetum coccineum]